METAQIQPKVLMRGANALVRDNVRVLLGGMGYRCLVASTLKEALALLELQKPDAAILDPQQADSPPARIVAAFHKMVPHLRGRVIVLIGEESDSERSACPIRRVSWVGPPKNHKSLRHPETPRLRKTCIPRRRREGKL